MNTVGFIFARGGSKGVPRKNVRKLGGKPLIAYAIQTGQQCARLGQVVVSTDDQEIAEVARQFGARVPFMRPSELAQDSSPEWACWQHAIREIEAQDNQRLDVFVSIPATSPFRGSQDIEAALALLDMGGADIVISVTPASRSPYFNMVQLNADSVARLMIEPSGKIFRRQDAPVAYDITTVVYAAHRDFVLNASRVFDGCVKAIVVPPERALDIDTELDFQFAEFLVQRTNRAES